MKSFRNFVLMTTLLTFGYAGFSQQNNFKNKDENVLLPEENILRAMAKTVIEDKFTRKEETIYRHYYFVPDFEKKNLLGYKVASSEDSLKTEYILTKKVIAESNTKLDTNYYTASVTHVTSKKMYERYGLVIVGFNHSGTFANYIVSDIFQPNEIYGFNKRESIACKKSQMNFPSCEDFKVFAIKEIVKLNEIYKK